MPDSHPPRHAPADPLGALIMLGLFLLALWIIFTVLGISP